MNKLTIFIILIFIFSILGSPAQAQLSAEDILEIPATTETTATAPTLASFSCPIPNGKISTHSHQIGITQPAGGGHCTPGFYGLACGKCGIEGRRAKAIDVPTNGQDVLLPQINGQDVNWTVITDYSVKAIDGGGFGYTFETNVGADKWHIDFLHMAGADVRIGGIYKSGSSIGKVIGAHVHFTVGKNINGTPAAGSDTDCDPGWLPSDFVCDPSLQPTGSTTSTPTGTSRNSKSNNMCVKIGNPTDPNPAACNATTTSPDSTTPLTPGTVGPAPNVEADQLVQTIKSQFNVDMQGAWNERALRWVYEAFYRWQTTNPQFMALINGQPVILIADASGANAFGNTVKVGQTYAEGDKFLGTLVHEFSHVIYHTKPLTTNLRIEADNVYGAPGPVTSYGVGDLTENYPEMISYCLTKRPVGALISEQRWASQYRPLAERIVGPCL